MSEALKTPELQKEPKTSPTEDIPEKKTPGKRGRLSFIERAQKESEELVKNMGGTLELEGGRRTRSSARGTPTRPAVVTPPPTKKARNSPASPKPTTPRGRGRGRKIDTSVTPEPPEQVASKEEENENQKIEEDPVIAESAKETTVVKEKVVEDVKTNEINKTNGPEKSTPADAKHPAKAEVKTTKPVESVVDANESKIELPPTGKEKETPGTEAATVEENKAADQVDAKLETIKEQESSSQSVEEHKNESVKPKVTTTEAVVTAKVDSPMDVDEQSEQSKDSTAPVVEKVAEIVEKVVPVVVVEPPIEEQEEAPAVVVEKQPTPEPMEVDSSSKSSDVIECTDVVDTTETIASKTAVTNEATNSIDNVVEKTATINKVNANVNDVAVANDISAVKSIAAVIPAVDTVAESHNDVVNDIKAENDVVKLSVASQKSASTADAAPVTAVSTS